MARVRARRCDICHKYDATKQVLSYGSIGISAHSVYLAFYLFF